MKLVICNTSQEPLENEGKTEARKSKGRTGTTDFQKWNDIFKMTKDNLDLEQAKNLPKDLIPLKTLKLSEVISQLLITDLESAPASHKAEKLPEKPFFRFILTIIATP